VSPCNSSHKSPPGPSGSDRSPRRPILFTPEASKQALAYSNPIGEMGGILDRTQLNTRGRTDLIFWDKTTGPVPFAIFSEAPSSLQNQWFLNGAMASAKSYNAIRSEDRKLESFLNGSIANSSLEPASPAKVPADLRD